MDISVIMSSTSIPSVAFCFRLVGLCVLSYMRHMHIAVLFKAATCFVSIAAMPEMPSMPNVEVKWRETDFASLDRLDPDILPDI